MPLYTRVPRDPNTARRAVNRPDVLQWFTRPGGESHRFNLLADLGRIRCPTLVLGGEDDPIHPIESQADIAAALPGSSRAIRSDSRIAGMPSCQTHRSAPWR